MGIDVYKQIMYWKENVRLNQNTMRLQIAVLCEPVITLELLWLIQIN